jgi:hypothetical protein
MSWESLPYDVRFLVLRTVCADIISDFEELCHTAIWDIAEDGLYVISDPEPSYLPPLTWPAGPDLLNSFISAITTCREFNDIILNQVKFDGVSPPDALKTQQAATIWDIADALHDGYTFRVIDMGRYYQATGPFWKNPIVISEMPYIPCVLEWSAPRCYSMLLPHLEPWLDCHLLEDETHLEHATRLAYCKNIHEDDDLSCHFDVKLGLRRYVPGSDYISNIDSVALGWKPGHSLAEQDLRASPAGQWWLFLPFSFAAGPTDKVNWVLVNYNEERMYIGPDASIAHVWKGRDAFRMYTWERFKSMEYIQNFGKN